MKAKTSSFACHFTQFALSLPLAKIGCTSEMKAKTSSFACHFTQFALSLQRERFAFIDIK